MTVTKLEKLTINTFIVVFVESLLNYSLAPTVVETTDT